jgi:hypothetical protein
MRESAKTWNIKTPKKKRGQTAITQFDMTNASTRLTMMEDHFKQSPRYNSKLSPRKTGEGGTAFSVLSQDTKLTEEAKDNKRLA